MMLPRRSLLPILLPPALLFAGKVTEFTIVTTKGYVVFAVPSDWRVGSMQTKPPVTASVFQIPNAADANTGESTNLVVSLYSTDTDRGRAALDLMGKPLSAQPATAGVFEGWRTVTQNAMQGRTAYTVIDAMKKVGDVTVGVRIAWPHLPANPSGYDQQMVGALHGVLHSVSGGLGPPPKREGGSVGRPNG